MELRTFTPQEEFLRKASTRKMVTWLIAFAIVMFFAGLTSAYVVSKSGSYWVHFAMPTAFHFRSVGAHFRSQRAQVLGACHAGDHFGAGPGLHL